jgi:hypothetical protein
MDEEIVELLKSIQPPMIVNKGDVLILTTGVDAYPTSEECDRLNGEIKEQCDKAGIGFILFERLRISGVVKEGDS